MLTERSLVQVAAASCCRAALLLVALVGSQAAAAADAPVPIAVFGFELSDTSGAPEPEVHASRLALASEEMRTRLAETGRYAPVDTSPAAQRIAEAGYLRTCNGCELDIARDLGADQALIATVHKISNLILYISAVITDVRTGQPTFVGTVSIRGDTDTAWLRGVRYLVKNKIVASGE